MKGVKNDKAILVVDVTDRYENRDYFHKATKEKVDKYIPCLNHLIVTMRYIELLLLLNIISHYLLTLGETYSQKA